jgi:hypothetical protein
LKRAEIYIKRVKRSLVAEINSLVTEVVTRNRAVPRPSKRSGTKKKSKELMTNWIKLKKVCLRLINH